MDRETYEWTKALSDVYRTAFFFLVGIYTASLRGGKALVVAGIVALLLSMTLNAGAYLLSRHRMNQLPEA